MTANNKVKKIDNEIQKLMDKREQLLEKHQKEIGKQVIKHWGESAMTDVVFEALEHVKDNAIEYMQSKEKGDMLSIDHQENYETNPNNSNDEQ